MQPQLLGGLKGSQAQLPHRDLADPGVPLSASLPRAFLQPSPWSCCFPAAPAMDSSRTWCVPSSRASSGPCGEQGLGQQDKPARPGRTRSAGERDVQGEEQGSVSVPAGRNAEEAAAAGTSSGQAPLSLPRAAVLAWGQRGAGTERAEAACAGHLLEPGPAVLHCP